MQGSSITAKLILNSSAFSTGIKSAIRDIGRLEKAIARLNGISSRMGKAHSKNINQQYKVSQDTTAGLNALERKLEALHRTNNSVNVSASQSAGIWGRFKGQLGQIKQGFTGFVGSIRTNIRAMADYNKQLGKTSVLFQGIREWGRMLVVQVLMASIGKLMEATKATLNARTKIAQFGKQMKWTTGEVNRFNKEVAKQQTVFRKINMAEVGGEVMNIAKIYRLSAEEATKFVRVSAVFTSAMAAEGRSTREASLALKDYIDQGAGWTRRMSELGITRENLLATGKWKGAKDDILGMIEALDAVMIDRRLDDTAKHINTLDEAWQALTTTMGMWIADVISFVSPAILLLVKSFFQIQSAVGNAWNALPDWVQAGVVIGGLVFVIGALTLALIVHLIPAILGTTSKTLIMIAELFGLATAAQAAELSLLGLLGVLTPVIAALIVLAAAVVAAYLVMQEATSTMRKYRDALDNGEEKIQAMKDASNAYKEEAKRLIEVKKQLIKEGKDTSQIEKQIAEAYRKSAEAAKEAEEAEKALKEARQKDAILDHKIEKSRQHYNKETSKTLYEMGIMSKQEYQSAVAFEADLTRGLEKRYAAYQRQVRIQQIGSKQIKDIQNENTGYSKAWKNDSEGLKAYTQAWKELGDAVYDLNTAEDPGQLIMAWGRVAWLQASIWIGEIIKVLTPFTDVILVGVVAIIGVFNPLVGAILGVISVFEKFGEVVGWWTGWGDMFTVVGANIRGAFEHIINIVGAAWTVLSNLFSGRGLQGIDGLKSALSNAGQALSDWIEGIWEGVSKIPGIIGSAFGNLQGMINNYWKASADFLNSITDRLTDGKTVKKFTTMAKEMIQGFLDWIKKLPDMVSQWLSPEKITGGSSTQANAREGGKEVGENFLGAVLEAMGRLAWELPGVLWTVFNELAPVLIQIVPTLLSVLAQIGLTIMGYVAQMIWNGIEWVGQQIYLWIEAKLTELYGMTIGRTIKWGEDLKKQGEDAGRKFVNGVIEFIKNLPHMVAAWLWKTISGIFGFKTQGHSSGQSVGSSILQGVKSGIMGIVDAVISEFKEMVQGIKNQAGAAYRAAKGVGDNIKNAIMGALDRHSPGIIQRETLSEFDELIAGVKDRISNAKNVSSDFARGMVDSVGNKISNISNINPNLPTMNATVNMSTSNLSGDFRTEGDMALGYARNIQSTASNTFNKLNNTVGSTFKSLGTTTKNTFLTMSDNTLKSMTQLRTGTVSQMGKVKSSWNGLHDNLVKSATDIRVKTGNQINKLQTNMASFWRKISNPVLLLSGSAGGYAGGGSTKFIRRPPSISGGFAGGTSFSEPRSFRMLDGKLPLPPCDNPLDEDSCYAGWNFDWSPSIRKTFMKWKPNFPSMYGLLNVAQFENDDFPVRGNLSAFSNWIYDVISKTNYKLYYDSAYGGTLSQILGRGWFNCWDGAHIVMALARQWGLPAHLERGYWGQTRHVWANVAGKQIDTTAIQKGHGFTSQRVSNQRQSLRDVTGSLFRSFRRGEAAGDAGSDGNVKVVNVNMANMFDGAVIQGGKEAAKEIADVVMDIIDSEFDVDPATGV